MINIAIDGKNTALPLAKALQLMQQKATRQPKQAVLLGREILAQQPETLPVYHILFALLSYEKDYKALKNMAEQAINYFPADPTSFYALSTALRYLHDPNAQLAALEKAIKLAPEQIHWQKQLAICLKELGKFKQAVSTFNLCISKNVSICECLYWRYAITNTLAPNELEILKASAQLLAQSEELKRALQKDVAESIYAAYCLFDYLDKQKEFDQAWHYLTLANCIKRQTFNSQTPYSIDNELKEHKLIGQHFDRELFNHYQTAQPESLNETQMNLFICGLPRSGTTLTEQILSSHSAVTGGDELFSLAESTAEVLMRKSISEAFPLWVKKLDETDWLDIGLNYQEKTKNLHQRKTWLTDKMPLNYKAIGIIHLALPKAKIVYCQRQPMDILWGCYKQMLGSGNAFTYQLDELCDMIIAHHEVMQYWLTVIPEKIFILNYQKLIDDQEATTRSLLRFIGLPWQQACLDFHLNERIVHTISNVQIRQPLLTENTKRWLPYEEQLKPYQLKLQEAGLID